MNENNNPEVREKKKLPFWFGIIVGMLCTVILCVAVVIGINVYKLATGTDVIYGGGSGSISIDGNSGLSQKLDTISSYLDNYFLYEVDEESLEEGFCDALIDATGDKYAAYYTPEEYQQLIEESSGQYAGIGVSVTMNDAKQIVVAGVFKNTPAEAAGIKVKDIIAQAGGQSDFDNLDDLVSIVRGEPGTTVDLVILRDGKYIELTVERAIVETESVAYKMLDGNIGYIQLSSFDLATVEQFRQAVEAVKAEGAKSLIVDVRDNPGGDYDSVVAISDMLLPAGKIITTKDKYGNEETEYSTDEARICSLPMVIICNENSASAAELFTGALQDHGVAEVVGTQTFGKGIVQSIFRLYDGSGLKFTTQEYFTPNGNPVHEVGITPDYVVEIPEEAYEDGTVTAEEDTQLQKAIEILTQGSLARK